MADPEEIASLRPGDRHFMAYVGPPTQYDLMGATQFALLVAMGLRANHTLLDVGCGSLRAGRLLIPYLDKGHYFGIEPNAWLVEDGIAEHFGSSIYEVKAPRFQHNDDFDGTGFGTKFDFVLAQSILSHTGRDMALQALRAFGAVLAERGLALVTFCDRDQPAAEDEARQTGWIYPDVVRFHELEVTEMAQAAGLAVTRLSWFHPRQVWYAVGLDDSALPPQRAREQRGDTVSWPGTKPAAVADQQTAGRTPRSALPIRRALRRAKRVVRRGRR